MTQIQCKFPDVRLFNLYERVGLNYDFDFKKLKCKRVTNFQVSKITDRQKLLEVYKGGNENHAYSYVTLEFESEVDLERFVKEGGNA